MSDTLKAKPIMVGVIGATASGKTSICEIIHKNLGVDCAMIPLDNFYKGLGEADHNNAENYDFDHPSALDMDLAFEKLREIKSGKDIEIPTYDFTLHARTNEIKKIRAAPVVIFEGILSLYEEKIRDLMDLKIFVLTDMDICLSRRLLRDIRERGRSVHSVLV